MWLDGSSQQPSQRVQRHRVQIQRRQEFTMAIGSSRHLLLVVKGVLAAGVDRRGHAV